MHTKHWKSVVTKPMFMYGEQVYFRWSLENFKRIVSMENTIIIFYQSPFGEIFPTHGYPLLVNERFCSWIVVIFFQFNKLLLWFNQPLQNIRNRSRPPRPKARVMVRTVGHVFRDIIRQPIWKLLSFITTFVNGSKRAHKIACCQSWLLKK